MITGKPRNARSDETQYQVKSFGAVVPAAMLLDFG